MDRAIKEAKNSLSSLIEVTNRGKRMIELVPVQHSQAPDRGLGWLKGKSELPKDFGTAKWKKSGTDAVLRDMGLS